MEQKQHVPYRDSMVTRLPQGTYPIPTAYGLWSYSQHGCNSSAHVRVLSPIEWEWNTTEKFLGMRKYDKKW